MRLYSLPREICDDLHNSRQKPPSSSQTPYHQQLGRTLIFVRSELIEPVVLVFDADHELIGCSYHFPQSPR